MRQQNHWFARFTLVAFSWLVTGPVAGESPEIPGPHTTVAAHNGALCFLLDGEPCVTPVFETYAPTTRHFRQFAKAGCRVYGFPANCGAEPWEHSVPVWVGPDVWDFSEFDENVAKIITADPEALIIPRVHVGEPAWWRKKNPAALIRFSDGSLHRRQPYRLWPEKKSRTYPSIASTHWRNDMALALRRLIEHVQQSDYAERVFGYHVYGLNTEEWYHYYNEDQLGDYSDNVRLDFQQWLRQKYRTDQALAAAWNVPSIDWEAVVVPSHAARSAGNGRRPFRDPRAEMPVIDYYEYYNELMAETIDYFCGVVKEATNRQKVVGAFYAYLFEFSGNPESGHLAVQKLLRSNNLDFIVVTASYGQRQLGSGGSILRSPHTSIQLHNKLWYEDNDNVSFLFPEVAQRIGDQEWERSRVVLAATDSAEETKWIYQRGAGFSLANGVHQSFFDLHGGYFDHPQIMSDIAALYRVFQRSRNYDLSSVAEILVVADELSAMYTTRHSRLLSQNLYDPPYRLIKCGAPYDAVYVDDLDRLDTSRYKLVIVLNAYHLTDAQEQLINRQLKLPGQTVLWSYAPGLFRGNQRDASRMSRIVEMELQVDTEQFLPPRIEIVSGAATCLSEVSASVMGPTEASSHLIQVVDTTADVLGRLAGGEPAVLARKAVDNWISVYSITASLPSEFYRGLAREAGVHIYNDRNDTLYVNKSYLTINADGQGRRDLRLLQSHDVYDAISEQLVAQNVDAFSVELRDKETRILRLEHPSSQTIK